MPGLSQDVSAEPSATHQNLKIGVFPAFMFGTLLITLVIAILSWSYMFVFWLYPIPLNVQKTVLTVMCWNVAIAVPVGLFCLAYSRLPRRTLSQAAPYMKEAPTSTSGGINPKNRKGSGACIRTGMDIHTRSKDTPIITPFKTLSSLESFVTWKDLISFLITILAALIPMFFTVLQTSQSQTLDTVKFMLQKSR